MHVSHHLKLFAFTADLSPYARVRKKRVDPNLVAPVKDRSSEEEPPEEKRRPPRRPSAPLDEGEAAAAKEAKVSEAPLFPPAPPAVAAEPPTSPLGTLLAGITKEAPAPESDGRSERGAASNPSVDDLLALMRAPSNPRA